MNRIDIEALTALLDARLDGVRLTPGERAEALCIALGLDGALSAAARGVSADTVRAQRRRLRRKLDGAISHPPAGCDRKVPGAPDPRPPRGSGR